MQRNYNRSKVFKAYSMVHQNQPIWAEQNSKKTFLLISVYFGLTYTSNFAREFMYIKCQIDGSYKIE